MIEQTMNWDAMTPVEKTQWLSHYMLGAEQNFEFGENKDTYWLLRQCELRIQDSNQQGIWIKNVTSEVSAHVYDGLTDAQIQQPETLWKYYAYFHTAPFSLRGRALYFAHRGLAV